MSTDRQSFSFLDQFLYGCGTVATWIERATPPFLRRRFGLRVFLAGPVMSLIVVPIVGVYLIADPLLSVLAIGGGVAMTGFLVYAEMYWLLRNMNEQVLTVEAGEYDLSFAHGRRDNIGDIFDTFESVAADLGDSIAEAEHARETAETEAQKARAAEREAARAGDDGGGQTGQGFAVVAEEVRELAERTAQATDKIEDMVRSVQAETSEAVGAIEEGQDEIEAGIDLAGQAATGDQISESVQTISEVSEESAEGIEGVSEAAKELDALADNLRGLVQEFTLHAGAGDGASPAHAAQPSSSAPSPTLDAPNTKPDNASNQHALQNGPTDSPPTETDGAPEHLAVSPGTSQRADAASHDKISARALRTSTVA